MYICIWHAYQIFMPEKSVLLNIVRMKSQTAIETTVILIIHNYKEMLNMTQINSTTSNIKYENYCKGPYCTIYCKSMNVYRVKMF